VRVEAGTSDELVLIIDVTEVSGLLNRKVSPGALRAGLPGQAGKLADAVLDMTGEARAQEPRTIRSVTVRVVESRTIASETLLLSGERQVYT
jgi:hypothetical protein